jgi:hypothetical protein
MKIFHTLLFFTFFFPLFLIGGSFACAETTRPADILPLQWGENTEGKYVRNLPQGDILSEFIPRVIKIILSLSSLVGFVLLIYIGIQYISPIHEAEANEKLKQAIIWIFAGIVVMLSAYALVEGILKLDIL